MLTLEERFVVLPALASAHSHAFQRAMRGTAQRPGPSGSDDFWSWRRSMYELAESLTPESLYDISKVAYDELRRRGVLTVGEFHYVHHHKGGIPYDDRTIMADAVIRAALDAGLRIGLMRVVYQRRGPGQPPEGAQQRFSDASLDDALADVETLQSRYGSHPSVRIGIAPHSVRAVPPAWLPVIAEFARKRSLMVHMHVAEQRAEIDACVAETGRRPVELCADHGLLSESFVAVHATHLLANEAALLGAARSFVCLCPTTERDLGDGLPDLGALWQAGVRLCAGVDSHVASAPLEDLRGIELGERLRVEKRNVLAGRHDRSPAEELWHIGSTEGAEASGFDDVGGKTLAVRAHPDLLLVGEANLLDAIVYSAQADVIAGVRAEPAAHEATELGS